ncbi:hypothetical protein F5Y04DRAFT_74505 [Hypomontagnella monticulosa]|nr:hypothetical protein F5Y04DRAFT_74505 [Hypomontagnella monticulosa]
MAAINDEVRGTLTLIENARLPHPSGPLLKSFVTEALNPVLAARYVKDKLLLGEGSSLVVDLSHIIDSISHNGRPPPSPNPTEQRAITRRDGGKCCVTGKAGTLRDPLIVAPILPIPSGWSIDKAGITDMLGAFFGSPYRDWWLSYIRDPENMTPCRNHWLIRKSAAKAFASGLVRLDRLSPSMVEYELSHVIVGLEEPIEVDGAYPLLGDHSRSGIAKVDPRFVGTHARFSTSIQYLNISKRFSAETTPQNSGSSTSFSARRSKGPVRNLLGICARASLTLWLLTPGKIRITCYKMLRMLGEYIYGKPGYHTVQRLPFGLYLKYHGQADECRNEFNALGIVRRHTSITVPKALDIYIEQGNAHDPIWGPSAYLLMTRVPGVPVAWCQDVLSDRDMEQIKSQLKDYIAQLRDIPRLVKSDMAICNTLGEACMDHRIRGATPVGPFADEAAFSQVLRFSDDPARRGHKIVFTHADLNPRNILIDQTVRSDGSVYWSVTGIVDWESAGYYPEYWDYTKAMFERFRWTPRYNDLVHSVFREFQDYSREFDVEKRSWESGDGV